MQKEVTYAHTHTHVRTHTHSEYLSTSVVTVEPVHDALQGLALRHHVPQVVAAVRLQVHAVAHGTGDVLALSLQVCCVVQDLVGCH